MTIRVLLADDHQLVRDGLRAIAEGESDIEIVAVAGNGLEAVRMARELRPDVLVLDVSMPDLNGVDAAGRVAALEDPPVVLALSMHADARYVRGMLQAGARGYLLKTSAGGELVAAIRAVNGGQMFVSSEIGGFLLDDYRRHLDGTAAREPTVLTQREREVLQLVAEGHTNASIAAALHLGAKTVETHRKRITEKLGLRSVAELTKYAVREGITSIDD